MEENQFEYTFGPIQENKLSPVYQRVMQSVKISESHPNQIKNQSKKEKLPDFSNSEFLNVDQFDTPTEKWVNRSIQNCLPLFQPRPSWKGHTKNSLSIDSNFWPRQSSNQIRNQNSYKKRNKRKFSSFDMGIQSREVQNQYEESYRRRKKNQNNLSQKINSHRVKSPVLRVPLFKCQPKPEFSENLKHNKTEYQLNQKELSNKLEDPASLKVRRGILKIPFL